MFVTAELNAIVQMFEDDPPSSALLAQLRLDYLNLEANLLRAKVLRDFSTEKLIYIAQAPIAQQDCNLAYLFAPFILANLNKSVIYSTTATPELLAILNRYYQAEQPVQVNVDDVLQNFHVYLDLQDAQLSQSDVLFKSLIKALCRSDLSTLFLITDKQFDRALIRQIEIFLKIKIVVIYSQYQQSLLPAAEMNGRKLLFKNKDDVHKALCSDFAHRNALLFSHIERLNMEQLTRLMDDMFYAEHIFERISVYSEYMQTRMQYSKDTT
ncbi:hypothetical protein [Acinetobacter larvae]|uniref:Uncharacterized protein n=1 Tax=Acinetobacter larvae TaxID=1789224 RepID=A0A1B2M4B2_9GAMM|nr:hypothetical protein [Acinetobacter larvae]AOA59981.1 hypothetical protein BFG52_11580 [Acinetobacter larvae]